MVKAEECVGCGVCVARCKEGALMLDRDRVHVDSRKMHPLWWMHRTLPCGQLRRHHLRFLRSPFRHKMEGERRRRSSFAPRFSARSRYRRRCCLGCWYCCWCWGCWVGAAVAEALALGAGWVFMPSIPRPSSMYLLLAPVTMSRILMVPSSSGSMRASPDDPGPLADGLLVTISAAFWASPTVMSGPPTTRISAPLASFRSTSPSIGEVSASCTAALTRSSNRCWPRRYRRRPRRPRS